MKFYVKKLITQKSSLDELYERLYELEEALQYAKENGSENAEEIFNSLIETERQIESECTHPLLLNVSLVPDVFKCIYCGKEIWDEHILDISENQNSQNEVLFSPKQPYFGYTGRAHTYYKAIRDEYLQIIDEIKESENFDTSIKEIDDELDIRFNKRLKEASSLTKRLARRKGNNK